MIIDSKESYIYLNNTLAWSDILNPMRDTHPIQMELIASVVDPKLVHGLIRK